MTASKATGKAEEFDADDLARSAYLLADFFGGVVLDESTYKRVPRPSLLPSHYADDFRPQSEPDWIGDVELCPYAAEPEDAKGRIQLNVFAHAARCGPLQVSLTQIRDWYTIAKALHRDKEYLTRIEAIGKQFKHLYGDAEPDRLEPFTDWHTQDIEDWLWDLSVDQQRSAAIDNALMQMDLFA